VPINFNFNYFGRSYSQLTIITNGFVRFDALNTSLIAYGYSISGLNYDLITASTSGGIYYQNLNVQSSEFNSIKSDLNRLNAAFVPINLFRITYDNVPLFSSSSSIVSFQIILANDATKSYVLLKYASCAVGSPYTTPGVYYLSSSGQQMSNKISNPCTSSNVNLLGTWVFDVSSLNGKKRIFLNHLKKFIKFAKTIL